MRVNLTQALFEGTMTAMQCAVVGFGACYGGKLSVVPQEHVVAQPRKPE